MSNESAENDTSDLSESPRVEKEGPNVVGSTGRRSVVLISVVGLLLLFLCLWVMKTGRKKETNRSGPFQEVPEFSESYADASSPKSVNRALAVMPSSFAETLVPERNRGEERRTLLELRRKSPMVLFNSASLPSPASGKGGGGMASASADLARETVPLPRGFSPSVGANSHATRLGDRSSIMAQGKIIDAVLETAINSDHPGLLRALVSDDTYGDNGDRILLPRGSRLIGQYDSGIVQGQKRVFVLWERAIRPDGVDIQLLSAGTDSLGRTGVEGEVNHHFVAMFGAATLLSVIGAAAANVGAHPTDNANSMAAYRDGVAKSFSDAANTVLGEFIRIKPTIMVSQGERIKIFVSRDLYFDGSTLEENSIQRIP